MNLNWGIKIAVLYIGFVVLILTMAFMAAHQKVDLVSKDYYEQELHYQDKINKADHARLLKTPLTWEVKQDVLILKFPEQFKGQKRKTSIYFFRPSDASLDETITIPDDTTSVRKIATGGLKKGLYKMQINWEVNKEEYYNDGIIQLN